MKTKFSIFLFIITCICAQSVLSDDIKKLRVVSLSPVITEIVTELGAGTSLVGITDHCKKPENNTHVKSIGSYLNSSVESIYVLKPDVVIMPEEQIAFEEKLKQFKLKTIRVSNKSIDKIRESIKVIGDMLSLQTQAENLLSEKNNEMSKLQSLCNRYRGKKVIFLFDEGLQESRVKYYIASENSFYGDLLSTLGMEYGYHSSRDYDELSVEGILAIKPDVIFMVMEHSGGQKSVLSEVGEFKNTPTVFLPQNPVVYPGPRYPEIARLFCESKDMR